MSYARKPGATYLPPHVKQRERQPGPPLLVQARTMDGDTLPVNVAPLRLSYQCLRCRQEVVIAFPLLAQEWVDQCNAFGDAHRNCRG